LILFDSNILVAALFEGHPHYSASVGLVAAATIDSTMIAAHSLAETYSTMTRHNRPYRLSGPDAAAAIDIVAAGSRIVSLSPGQTVDAVRKFSAIGIGPRLYDYLIAATAEAFGASTIVTWNTRDFDGLFPALRVVTPEAFSPPSPPT